MNDSLSLAAFTFTAESLVLDFTNTAEWIGEVKDVEWLGDYARLLEWSQHAGTLTPDEQQTLLGAAEHDPTAAARAYDAVINTRTLLYRLFSGLVRQPSQLAADDLEFLNSLLADMQRRRRLVALDAGFVWEWRSEKDDLFMRPLWPILLSAGELLTSEDLPRIRQCAADDCSWLFVDHSRNGQRRWCSMTDCGNRAKARRHQARQRQKRS